MQVKRRRGVVTAMYEPLMLWGEGASLSDALEDFGQTLVELYLGLQNEPEQLGPGLAQSWKHIQQIMAPRA